MNTTQDQGWMGKLRMTRLWVAAMVFMLPAFQAGATQIWSGTRVSFVKTNNAVWTLPVNQDHITTNCWLTRKSSQGLFNIAQEAGYTNGVSPADTEWAYGTTAGLPLTFQSWTNWNGNNPTSSIGQDAVLHVISEDIYIDFKLTSWTGGAGGGGFSYERAMGPRVWNGTRMTFTKADYADWTASANQDRITPAVWITRQDDHGLFNIHAESEYASGTPSDTEWAYGTTADLASLSFSTWHDWARSAGSTPSIIGGDAVVHLISDDIYIDIKFSAWTSDGDGGGFAYSRAKAPVVVTMNSNRVIYVIQGHSFADPGATAATSDGVPLSVTRTGSLDTNTVGEYTFTYAAFDGVGNVGIAQRLVRVVAQLPQVWNRTAVRFAKSDYADQTQPENQDLITPAVSITRADSQGLFNIINESGYGSGTPSDTEWAFGSTSNYWDLTYRTWYDWYSRDPSGIIGRPAVLHLISEDIYLDITMTSWTKSANGGGFSYERAGTVFVTLAGMPSVSVLQGDAYTDPGVTAVDGDGNPLEVVTNGVVDTSTPGVYEVSYIATNALGQAGMAKRYVGVVAQLPQVWDGPQATFTKANYANWLLATNQDRISPSVWITRQDDQGLFNIKAESRYSSSTPSDTEWAYGSISNIWGLSFRNWHDWSRLRGDTDSIVGRDAVVHLISEDIYLPVKFLSWTSGRAAGGGGFSYRRALAPVVVTLSGDRVMYVLQGAPFTDPGAAAVDVNGTPLTVTETGTVDTNTVGSYTLTYRASDAGGHPGAITRTVNVVTRLPQVWCGPRITFTKADYADSTLPANQDSVTPGVLITRANNRGLFNAATESSYNGSGPSDTEWAYGTASNFWDLSFQSWHGWARSDGQTPDTVGRDAVMHIISEDIYIDVKFTSWTSLDSGGGFSYARAAAVAVTLNGGPDKYILQGDPFVDPGAVAIDYLWATQAVTVAGSVDVNVIGTYPLTYSASIPGYTSSVIRTVHVVTNMPAPKAAMMPSYARQITYANAALNEPLMVWGRAWDGAPPFQYSLNFGDGTPAATGTVSDVTFIGVEHAYASGGSKTATLTLTDDWGRTVVRQAVIKVVPTPTHEQRVNMAIEKGLIWTYLNQKHRDANRVYWQNEGEHGFGATGSSLLAFQENGHEMANDYEQDIYAETVQKGLNWVVDNDTVTRYDIYAHSDGIDVRNPDSNGNGKGIYLFNNTYATACGTMALILSQPNAQAASNTFVTSGPLAGMSYYDVVQDIFDQFCFSQGDGGNRGGWVYAQGTTDDGRYDGSAQQWPCLSFLAGMERWGMTPPQWVIDNAVFGFDQLQNANGGVGYSSSSSWLNIAKTGGAMTGFKLGGRTVTNDSVARALAYIGSNWSSNPDPGWAGDLYEMYGPKKGMMFQGVETVTTPNGVRNWYADMSAWLLGNKEGSTAAGMPYVPATLAASFQTPTKCFGQNADGSWESTTGYISGPEMGTATAVLILTKSVTKPLPVAVIAAVGEQPANSTPFAIDGSGSYHQDTDNSIVEYLWDWDASDGVDWNNPDATGARPTNPGYSTPGTNTVTLRVRDASDPANTSLATLQVIVTSGDVPPVAVAIPPGMPAYAGRVGGVITLDGSASYDPNGDTITNYVWDLNGNGIYGDGPDVSSTNPTASITFTNEYVGAIGLEVTANGRSGRSISQVEIFASSNDVRVVSILATNIVPDVSAELKVVLLNSAASVSDFSNVVIRFYNGNPLLSGVQISSNYLVNLPRGVTVPLNITLGGLAGVAPTNLFVYVDASLAIAEWDETNNVGRAVTETPPAPSLDPPVMLYPVDITRSNMLARWEGVTNAEAYELEVALDTNFVVHIPGYTGLNTALAQQYTVTGLTSGVWYALRVRAWNTDGYSEWSNIIWVPAGSNTPFETHPPVGGPVSDGAVMVFALTNLFHGTGVVYSAESSNTNVATVTVSPGGQLTIDPHDPGVATITVRATDLATGYTTSFSFVITVIGPPQLLSGVFRHERWNPRFEQLLTVTNTSGLNAIGIRLVFTNLWPGITVENRTGTFWDGRPMIEMQTAFTNGQALNLSVIYLCSGAYQVDQHPPTVEFQYILPAWQSPLSDAQLEVNGWLMSDGSNRIVLEFDTVVGALYAVEYMNNFPGGTWVQIPLRLRAGANRTQWIDSGPPATQPMQGVRVYRIKQLAE